jgi:CheY-like chemotaxis protein
MEENFSGMNETELQDLQVSGPVMVIDDDDAFREELKGMLEKAGIQVIPQSSAAHALRYIMNQSWNWYPSIVITDIVMDGMGGYQLIRRIQELYPNRNIPIIVISRLEAAADVNEAEVAGAAAYLIKPVEEKRLFETIGKVLARGKRGMLIFTADFGMRKKKKKKR